MKKIFTAIICAFLFSMTSVAQVKHTVRIEMKSGEVVEYATTDISNMNFKEVVEETPEEPQPQGELIAVSNIEQTANANGTIDITLKVKSTNATTIRCTPKPAADIEPYLEEDPETWSNFFLGFKTLSPDQVDEANSADGCTLSFVGIPNDTYYITARANDADGNQKTIVIKVE